MLRRATVGMAAPHVPLLSRQRVDASRRDAGMPAMLSREEKVSAVGHTKGDLTGESLVPDGEGPKGPFAAYSGHADIP